jgi:hypothetical protein
MISSSIYLKRARYTSALVGTALAALFTPFEHVCAQAATSDSAATKTATPEQPAKKKKADPFAFADFTWLNGNSRQKSALLDTKYFTGEFRADVNYVAQFHRPKDHTLVGTSELGRTSEFQLQQLGIGGDFHHAHVRGHGTTRVRRVDSGTLPTPIGTSPRRMGDTIGTS